MDLKQIEAFVRVAELGSFTRAAAAMGQAQPLLSRSVRQLEVELRQSLLLRNGRGVTLTEAGQVLLEHGRGILHQVALAREELGGVRGALAGRVSVGLPPSLSRLITVPLMQRFRAALPEAALTLTEGFSLPMHEGLRAGRLDFAVLYDPPLSPDLEAALLRRDALVLISPVERAPRKSAARSAPSERITLHQLATLPLILPSRPNAFRILIDTEMTRLNLKPRIELEVDGLNAILDLVREGLGHAILPRYTLSNAAHPEDYTTRQVTRPALVSPLMLVWSGRRPLTGTHRETRRVIEQVVTQAMKPYGNL